MQPQSMKWWSLHLSEIAQVNKQPWQAFRIYRILEQGILVDELLNNIIQFYTRKTINIKYKWLRQMWKQSSTIQSLHKISKNEYTKIHALLAYKELLVDNHHIALHWNHTSVNLHDITLILVSAISKWSFNWLHRLASRKAEHKTKNRDSHATRKKVYE